MVLLLANEIHRGLGGVLERCFWKLRDVRVRPGYLWGPHIDRIEHIWVRGLPFWLASSRDGQRLHDWGLRRFLLMIRLRLRVHPHFIPLTYLSKCHSLLFFLVPLDSQIANHHRLAPMMVQSFNRKAIFKLEFLVFGVAVRPPISVIAQWVDLSCFLGALYCCEVFLKQSSCRLKIGFYC